MRALPTLRSMTALTLLALTLLTGVATARSRGEEAKTHVVLVAGATGGTGQEVID